MLLTGPFGGLTDDVREFPRCLDGHGPDGLAAAMSGPEPPPSEERRLDSRSLLRRLGGDAGDDVVVLARGLNRRVPMTRLDRPFLATSPDGGCCWQPAKLAARLQAATTSGRPVLLRIDPRAGHGFGSTAGQRDSLLADELALLLDQLRPAPGSRRG